MGTYVDRYAALEGAYGRADDRYGTDPAGWRAACRGAAVELLEDAVGASVADLPPEEARVVGWAAETLDGPTVAALAALLDRARSTE